MKDPFFVAINYGMVEKAKLSGVGYGDRPHRARVVLERNSDQEG
jgi:hypothetical protein